MILDEVITGFRLGMGGATAYYGITPDIITYGKIIGGGMPVGAFGGRADIMAKLSPLGPVYQAGTLSGNPVAMAAGLATLKKLADGSIHSRLEEKNRKFVANITSRLSSHVFSVAGISSMYWMIFQQELPRSAKAISADGIAHYNRMHDKVLNRGVYIPPSGYEVCFVSAAHTDEMLEEAANVLVDSIEGEAHTWK